MINLLQNDEYQAPIGMIRMVEIVKSRMACPIPQLAEKGREICEKASQKIPMIKLRLT